MSIYLYLHSCNILTGVDQPFSKQVKKKKAIQSSAWKAAAVHPADGAVMFHTSKFFSLMFSYFTLYIVPSFCTLSVAFQTT